MSTNNQTIRDLKELYTIVLNRLRETYYFNNGVCHHICNCYFYDDITGEEKHYLIKDFRSRKPRIFSKFFWNDTYIKGSKTYDYWWDLNEKGKIERIKFLEHIISKL